MRRLDVLLLLGLAGTLALNGNAAAQACNSLPGHNAWCPSVFYNVGDIVTEQITEGLVTQPYQFMAVLPPAQGVPPSNCTASGQPPCKWTLVSLIGQLWDSGATFRIGDVVTYVGSLWFALADNTNIPPNSSAGHWRLLGTGGAIVNTNPFFFGDTSASIQSAIDAAPAGGVVQLRCVPYTVNATIIVRKNLTLQGCLGGTALNSSVSPAIRVGGAGVVERVTIRDLNIIGPHSGDVITTPITAISVFNCQFCFYERLKLSFVGTGILLDSATSNTINGVQVIFYRTSAVTIQHPKAVDAGDNSILNSLFFSNPTDGISPPDPRPVCSICWTSGGGLKVMNNKFLGYLASGSAGAIISLNLNVPALSAWSSVTTYAGGAGATFGGNNYYSLVDGNLNHQPDISPTFWALADPTIATGDMQINNNSIEHGVAGGYGIRVRNAGSGLVFTTIANNQFSTTRYAIPISIEGPNMSNVAITGNAMNAILADSTFGINLAGVDRVSVTGNVINGNGIDTIGVNVDVTAGNVCASPLNAITNATGGKYGGGGSPTGGC